MKSQRLRKMRDVLERKRSELSRGFGRREQLVAEQLSDPIDGVQSKMNRELSGWLIDSKWRTLQSVERALRLLEKGTYGICDECGEDISPRRLDAVPWAVLCLGCQEVRDESHVEEPSHHFDRAA